jgi:hypothetical protein
VARNSLERTESRGCDCLRFNVEVSKLCFGLDWVNLYLCRRTAMHALTHREVPRVTRCMPNLIHSILLQQVTSVPSSNPSGASSCATIQSVFSGCTPWRTNTAQRTAARAGRIGLTPHSSPIPLVGREHSGQALGSRAAICSSHARAVAERRARIGEEPGSGAARAVVGIKKSTRDRRIALTRMSGPRDPWCMRSGC